MTDGYDEPTSYGHIDGVDDPSMGWARYAQVWELPVSVPVRVPVRVPLKVPYVRCSMLLTLPILLYSWHPAAT